MFTAFLARLGPIGWTLNVPFLGTVDAAWGGPTRGRSWFDTAGIVSEQMNGGAELWFGSLRVQALRDSSIRPDWRTVALACCIVAEAGTRL